MRPSKPALPEWARPQDWAPTVENARRLGLPETTRPAANRRPSAERPANEPPALTRYLDHAGRAVNAAVNAIAEPVAMAVDLGMAGVGAAYTATTGKPADIPFISFANQDVAYGATAADLLNGMNPVYGLMVTAHEIGRAISFNDTGALAEIGGGMVGSMVGSRRVAAPVTFGRVANQVSHTFRHIDAAGLDRIAVQNAVRSDLYRLGNALPANPYNGQVIVNGMRIDYVAYALEDGTLNVERITPPR